MIELLEAVRGPSLAILAGLATYAVHSMLLLGAAWLIARRLETPRLRELLWKGALVGALVTTSAQGALGGGPLTLRSAPDPGALGHPSVERGLVGSSAGLALKPPIGADAFAPPVPTGSGTPAQEAAAESTRSAAAWIALAWPLAPLGAWAAWVLVGSLALLRQRRRLGRALAHRRRITDGPLVRMLSRMRRRGGPRRPIHLCTSPRIPSPIALGTSEICVPSFATDELSRSSQAALLAHELAHLRRLDAVWSTLAGVLARLFPFQPLQRVAASRLRAEAELLCDADAVRETGDGAGLARCLIEVAERGVGGHAPVWTAAMATRESGLVQRVELALAGGAESPRRHLVGVSALTSLLTAAAVACAGPGWSTKHEPPPGATAGPPEATAEPLEGEGAEALRALGYLSSEPPAEPPVRLVLDAEGAVLAGERLLLAAGDDEFEPVHRYLSEAAARMPRAPLSESRPGGPTLADGPLVIRAEAATPFDRVLAILQQCGRRDVLIWRIELDLEDARGERETYDVPLPRDVGVHADPRLAPPRFELEVGRETLTLRLPEHVDEPELDWNGRRPTSEQELEARLLLLFSQHPDATLTIDTDPETRSDRAAAVLGCLPTAGAPTVTFVGRGL